jgi:hypothetical protein
MLLKKEIVHRINHMDQIKVHKNLVYRIDDSENFS